MGKLNNPAAIGKKWAQRASNAAGDYKAGVNDVTENPMDKAAAAVDTWQRRVSSPEARSKFVSNLQGRPISDWKSAATGKGAQNYVTGVQAAESKMTAFAQDVAPFMLALQQRVRSMPNATAADRQARAIAWMTGMAEYQRRR